nr:hypothetical protein [Tanacetum cinerariifolium]
DQEIEEEGDADEHVEEVTAGDDAHGDDTAAHGEVPTVTQEPSIPFPTPAIPLSQPPQDIPSTSQAEIYKIDMDHANKVLSVQEDESEPTEVQEVIDVVTTAKLITKVITAASATILTTEPKVPTATLTAAPA